MSGYHVKCDLRTEENWKVFQRYKLYFGPDSSDLVLRALNFFYVEHLERLETHEALRERPAKGPARVGSGTKDFASAG